MRVRIKIIRILFQDFARSDPDSTYLKTCKRKSLEKHEGKFKELQIKNKSSSFNVKSFLKFLIKIILKKI